MEKKHIHFGFVVEQALGHRTHGQNLQKVLAQDPDITIHWGLPSWENGGWERRLPGLRSNWTIRAGLQARRAVAAMQQEVQLDALFFHTQVPAVLAQDWVGRIPSIVSLDATPRQYDELGEFYAHDPGPAWLEDWKWRLNRRCFHKARHLVTWSAWAKGGLVEEYGVLEEKVTVIPPGVRVPDWTPSRLRRQEADPVKILFVGGNLKRKGGGLLLQAFRILRQRAQEAGLADMPELHLVTQDDVAPEPGVYAYHKMQPNSPELKQLYFDSHVFCLPTYGDCLPMVLSEAGAAGLPLVSTRVAAIPEIVRPGETGFLIAVGEVAPLADALWELVKSPALRTRMGAAAARLVQREFDAEANAYRLLDLLKSIVLEPRAVQAPA